MCVGPPASLADQVRGYLNISWDPLPCHLLNGADIYSYIIQYTRLPNSTPRNISISDSSLKCRQMAGGPYSCLADRSLFITRPDEMYRFQVAALSVRGVGSFSNPVNFVFGFQGKDYIQ